MSQRHPIRAKGATRFDLLGMNDEDFERMNARLIRLEHPTAFKPANVSDGGADMVEPKQDRSGYARCWQSKHYPNNIRWSKCEQSLSDARKNWKPERYTFIFPRELTVGEQKTFDEKFGSLDIPVDYWNGEELQGRLTASDQGERIARHFFDDVELQRERTNQAIEAGGRLDNPEDALDRLANIGAFLASDDAYFSYPAATHEQGGPGPPVTPGAVMSFAKGDGKVQSRVDVVPRDEEAMERYGPEFVLEPAEGEAGQRAAKRLQEALREGKDVEIDEGIDVTFTRMPPGFKDVVGERLTGGKLTLGRVGSTDRPVSPWKAHLRASSGEGNTSLNVHLSPMAEPPPGWDSGLSGSYGGLTVTALFRRREQGGELRWNFHFSRDDAPVREQLNALIFMRVISAAGELTVTDEGNTGRPELAMPTPVEPLAPELRALLAFLEDLSVIEEWANVEYRLPESITGGEAQNVALVANFIRNQGRAITWQNFEMTVPTDGMGPLRQGRLVRVETPVAGSLLGQTVQLGYAQLDLAGYTVVSEQPAANQPGYTVARIEPASDEAAAVFERLAHEATAAKRRPPPPPRKRGQRKRGGKKRR